MCGLCGVFGTEHHWSARRADGQSADAPVRRRERARRVSLLNRMLARRGVSVREWQGTAYLVRGATGRSEVTDDLAEIWRSVERIGGRPFDPLDVPVPAPGSATARSARDP